MILSRYNLQRIDAPGLELPGAELFELPEKVLQFGTGVLLRGLPDYYIDKANRAGIFNGRVVVVKSTGTGNVDDFDKQDNLYTIYSRGLMNGQEVCEQIISSAISRVLSASNQWDEILEFAKSPDLRVIISNTTEVGIKLVNEDIFSHPPASYPSKLVALLYARYNSFKGSADSGLVVVPTELIADNAKKLQAIVLELAHLNKLEPAFLDWLEDHNHFCNSLVDRIVPGGLDRAAATEADTRNGYTDKLAITTETYSLWAIEGDDEIKAKLSFALADDGVVITPDIELFRELKLRLLNGTHTLSCAYAYISGFKTVNEALTDEQFAGFVTQLMFDEIAPAIPYRVDKASATDFGKRVLDRFRNPYIRHEWLSISVQYTTKLKMRVVPLLLNYYKIFDAVPHCMALSIAAFIRFMRVKCGPDGRYVGSINNTRYEVTDNHAVYFASVWENTDSGQVIEQILKNEDLWDTRLDILPGFTSAVIEQFNLLNKD